jgi:ABC-type sugar transport system ATPase subunit
LASGDVYRAQALGSFKLQVLQGTVNVMSSLLKITDLHVSVANTQILRGVNMEIRQGEIHALMGPNGSGKSTLAYALLAIRITR